MQHDAQGWRTVEVDIGKELHEKLARMTKAQLIEAYLVQVLATRAATKQVEEAQGSLQKDRDHMRETAHALRAAEEREAELRERCALLARMCHALVRTADPDEEGEQ